MSAIPTPSHVHVLYPKKVKVQNDNEIVMLHKRPAGATPVQPTRTPVPEPVEAYVPLSDRKAQPAVNTPRWIALGLGYLVMTGLAAFNSETDPNAYLGSRLAAGFASAGFLYVSLRSRQVRQEQQAEHLERQALAATPIDGPAQLKRVMDEACKSKLNKQGLERAVDRILTLRARHPHTVTGTSAMQAMVRLAAHAIEAPVIDNENTAHDLLDEVNAVKNGLKTLVKSGHITERQRDRALQEIKGDLTRRNQAHLPQQRSGTGSLRR